MHQHRLLLRARALARLKCLPDRLLAHLFSKSDPMPEQVPQGVILFRQGERVQDWYLLLSGEVQLFLDQPGNQQQLAVVRPGTIFGELQPGQCHSCAARILKSAEFVRIGQNHFMALYNKWADQLQPCIMPMEDLSGFSGPSTSAAAENGQRKVSRQLPRSPSERRRNRTRKEVQQQQQRATAVEQAEGARHSNGLQRRENCPEEGAGSRHVPNGFERRRSWERRAEGVHLLELSVANRFPTEERLQTAVAQLGRAMCSTGGPKQVTGSEFCADFHVLWVQCLGQPPTNPLLSLGVGQALLDRTFLIPLRSEQPHFHKSSASLYKWALPPANSAETELADDSQLADSLLFLSNLGTDFLLQCILRKPEEQRTAAELELVVDEIGYMRAYNHLSKGMKRALARVMHWEGPEHAGTIIFREGEPARSWYVVLRGTLEANTDGRRLMLREGDDFGKLALLNGAPSNGQSRSRRQATVVTAQDGCQLLKVHSADFQRILREVETATVRLKQTTQEGLQKDVLVLQRDANGSHSLVAGLPEKILEYVLETRVDIGPEEELLEEVLLTQPIWMPSNRLCDALKLYFASGSLSSSVPDLDSTFADPHSMLECRMAAKKRVVQFLLAWQALLGNRLFLDPVANSFVEELYSCLLEEARLEPGERLDSVLAQMQGLMMRREQAMQRLSRPPRLVLDFGAYSADAPEPNPVLPCDICNQVVLLPDSSQLTLQIRLDQSAGEIAKEARLGRERRDNGKEQMASVGPDQCLLFELSSDGQKVAILGGECGVPTMLSPGSILMAALPSESARIPLFPLPSKLSSFHSSLVLLLGPDRLARAFASFHFKLLNAISQAELLVELVGRDQFPARLAPVNLDLLQRRFAQIQLWASSEVLLAPDSIQRLAVLRGLIQLAQRAKAYRDLLALAALCLGLSALPVSQLGSLWARLPERVCRLHAQNQSLLWPARGHRNYRLFARPLQTPKVPFVPLLLKEMDFVHQSRPSHLADGLVSWEKMHLLGQFLRTFQQSKGVPALLEQFITELGDTQTQMDEALVRNLHTLEDHAKLNSLSMSVQRRE